MILPNLLAYWLPLMGWYRSYDSTDTTHSLSFLFVPCFFFNHFFLSPFCHHDTPQTLFSFLPQLKHLQQIFPPHQLPKTHKVMKRKVARLCLTFFVFIYRFIVHFDKCYHAIWIMQCIGLKCCTYINSMHFVIFFPLYIDLTSKCISVLWRPKNIAMTWYVNYAAISIQTMATFLFIKSKGLSFWLKLFPSMILYLKHYDKIIP